MQKQQLMTNAFAAAHLCFATARFTYSLTAADSTQQVLQSADLQVPDLSKVLDQASSTALLALNTVRTVALVLLVTGLGLVCLVASLHTHHKYRQLQDGVDAGG
jgi:hypothetical protein